MRARCSELEPELRKERKMTAPTRMRRTAERAKVSLVVVDALLFLVVGREGRSTVEEDISRMGGSWGRLYEAGAESSGSEYTWHGIYRGMSDGQCPQALCRGYYCWLDNDQLYSIHI